MNRSEDSPGLTGTLPPAVIVHGLAMAQAALAPGLPVTLLSARGAAVYAGVGWWQALVRAAAGGREIPDILDCGDAPGRALEALRAGQRRIVLQAAPSEWGDIAGRAAGIGTIVLAEAPASLDLGRPGAERLLAAWLGQSNGTVVQHL